MSMDDTYGTGDDSTVHEAVGAYVLGILDDAEATAFEAHLAGCQVCVLHLEEFSGMEPMLAMLADDFMSFGASVAPPDPAVTPPGASYPASAGYLAPLPIPAQSPTPAVPVQPSARLLDRLVDEVAVKRAKRKHRGMYLVAAAAALIIGGPVVALVATSDGGAASNQAAPLAPHPTSPAEGAFFSHMTEKVHATDPTTKVTATVGMEAKGWGTQAVLEFKNVKGPLKCSLVAVSKTGEEEVVTSWSVPVWGYGITDSAHAAARYPLYVHGEAAMKPGDVDHFEVRTFDGKRLVEVAA